MTARVPMVAFLVALAAIEVASGAGWAAVLGGAGALDPSRWLVGALAHAVVLAAALVGGAGLAALLAVVAALGLAIEAPWGRRAALAAGVGALATGCFPVGLALLGTLWASSPAAPSVAPPVTPEPSP